MISLIINGKTRRLEGPTALADYLASLDLNTKNIAVAHNGTVLRKSELAGVTLADGDQVEIVRAVGGG